MKTVREEEKLTSRLASLQVRPVGSVGLGWIGLNMVNIIKDADKLRINTLKEVISVLTPVQAVDYLATGKKLHLNVHEWGKQRRNHRDREHSYHGGASSTTLAN
ncbi:Protein DELAY OF GERMINATION 1 [Linum grandiflorum]